MGTKNQKNQTIDIEPIDINAIARIGSWELLLETKTFVFNKISCDILGIPQGILKLDECSSYIKNDSFAAQICKGIDDVLAAQMPFDQEIELKTAQNKVIWVHLVAQGIYNDNKCVKIAGILQDISKQKALENKLIQKDELLNFTINKASLGYWEWKLDSNLVTCSENVYRLPGIEEDTPITIDTMINAVHPEDVEMVREHITKSVKTKSFETLFHRYIIDDGTERTMQVLGDFISDETGKITSMLCISQDISTKKHFETELLKKNQIFNVVQRRALLGHWQWDLKTKLVTCSENMSDLLEIEHNKNFAVSTLLKDVHPEDLESVHANLENTIKTKKFKSFSHRIVIDGDVREIQVNGKVNIDKNGDVLNVLGISQDITKLKGIENKLLENNRLLNFAEQKATLGNWSWNLVTNDITWSKNLYHIFDIQEGAQISVDTLFNYVHPEDLEKMRESIAEAINKKSFDDFLLHRIVLDNGTIKTLRVSGEVFTNEKDEVIEIVGISQDVTEADKNERDLLKKNQILNFGEQISKIGNWQWNLITNNVKWSKNLYRIFDHETSSGITFDIYFEYVHIDDRPKVTAFIDKLFNNKSFEKIIHRIVLKDGTIRTVELSATVNADLSGELVEMLGTCQDITAQRSEEIKFRGLLESAPNATLIINEDSIIQDINKQAEKLFGYKPQELVGQSVDMLVPSRFDAKRAQYKKSFLVSQRVQIMDIGEDLYMIKKKGEEIPVQITLGPLQTEEGLLISVAIRDISVERLAERNILEAKDHLELLTEELMAQNHKLADFTQITSHNLRAPVSNLNSILELYKFSEDEEERTELVEKFEIVIDHLTLTLNTLIEVLKTKSEKSIERSEVSFTKTLKKTEDILLAQISKSGTSIKCDFSQIDKLSYNQIYLESIFQNIIGNAIKYRHPERSPEITVTSEIENETIRLSFKDNGLGIDLKRPGHKLFGLNKVFHNHPEAKGVGLFMTKAQIEAMGGKISAQSQVGEGSIFTIEF